VESGLIALLSFTFHASPHQKMNHFRLKDQNLNKLVRAAIANGRYHYLKFTPKLVSETLFPVSGNGFPMIRLSDPVARSFFLAWFIGKTCPQGSGKRQLNERLIRPSFCLVLPPESIEN